MITTPIEEEYRALREGAGITELSWRGGLELLGPDRLRFLHNYVTCDVKGLAPGMGAYGFFTSPQGRILSDAVLLAQEDRLWVEVDEDQKEPVAAHLRKYILADRVEVRTLDDMRPVLVLGPGAEAVLGTDLSSLDAPWRHARITVHGTEVVVQRRGLSGVPAWTLWVSASEAVLLAKRLVAEGARPVGFEALEVLRAEAGIPRFGQDFGPDNFPQETGIEEAVSYTKGCYLGQEVVARIHYRGGVQNVLRGLVFDEGEPRQGAALIHDGREAGRATTVVRSLALNQIVGLGILHRRVEPGTRVAVEGGGAALVRP
ncbi:MAG TPA: glycine cleavage T C-terminal barrel domain-containing protein [Thermoanaerobaculia bacterium]|nr:glycine cleavage T C-terminal barrel domain-containing protein [Thermoanaerobaculia bacterium]